MVLTTLSYDGPLLEEKALLTAADGGLSSPEFGDLCRWLATRLKPMCDLEESITSGPGEPHPLTPDPEAQNSESAVTYLFIVFALTFNLTPDDMDSLQVEMSGLLKELHCPHEEVVSGILKGSVPNTKDHLKCVCM